VVEAVRKIPTDVQVPRASLFNKLPIIFIVLGLGALILWGTSYSQNPSRAMFSYLYAFIVALSLGLGALIFVLIQHVTRAGWSVAVRRIPEAIISLMPVFIILFIPIALSTHDIFPWTHTDHIDEMLARKLPYLNEPFFLMRSFAYLLVWAVMGVWFYRVSVMQDQGGRFELTRTMQAVSAPGIILFGLTLTFASFDWIMSLQPHWYSTIFGVCFFAGCFLFALATITLLSMCLQKAGVLRSVITPEHYHDLGKLMFGFIIFWAYVNFSQFMLYWYANIPEEIEFYIQRMHNGWAFLSWAMPVIHFLIPFLALMSRFLKRIKLVLAINSLWIIAVHLINLYWLILPAYHDPHEAGHGPAPFNIELVDILALVGIFGLFLGSFLFVLCRHSVVPVGDPRLKESLAFENF
jgi:hypothetical protein